MATSYKQRATNCHFQVCLLTLHDHKQQLTFLQRFKLIGLYILHELCCKFKALSSPIRPFKARCFDEFPIILDIAYLKRK